MDSEFNKYSTYPTTVHDHGNECKYCVKGQCIHAYGNTVGAMLMVTLYMYVSYLW